MENLRRIRKERKVTLKQLAKIVGVSEVSMCRYENGKRNMPIETAKKIAVFLGVKWYELYD